MRESRQQDGGSRYVPHTTSSYAIHARYLIQYVSSQGVEKVTPIIGVSLAEVTPVAGWNGDDGVPPEEEFSLEDLDKDEL